MICMKSITFFSCPLGSVWIHTTRSLSWKLELERTVRLGHLPPFYKFTSVDYFYHPKIRSSWNEQFHMLR
jgi:hypothetical protein